MLRDAKAVAGFITTLKEITEDYKAIGRKCRYQPTKQEVDALESSVLLMEAQLHLLQTQEALSHNVTVSTEESACP